LTRALHLERELPRGERQNGSDECDEESRPPLRSGRRRVRANAVHRGPDITSRPNGPRRKQKGPARILAGRPFLSRSRRRPTLPRRHRRSTIGAEGFHFRVRDGNGWVTFAIATGKDLADPLGGECTWSDSEEAKVLERSSSSIVVKPHGQLVQVSFTHCCASTSCLSTSSSSTGLQGPKSREISSWGGLPTYMLSAVIPSAHSYPAVPLARQPAH